MSFNTLAYQVPIQDFILASSQVINPSSRVFTILERSVCSMLNFFFPNKGTTQIFLFYGYCIQKYRTQSKSFSFFSQINVMGQWFQVFRAKPRTKMWKFTVSLFPFFRILTSTVQPVGSHSGDELCSAIRRILLFSGDPLSLSPIFLTFSP